MTILERFLKVTEDGLFQQNKAGGEVNKSQKGTGQFIISGGTPPEMLEFKKETFYKVSFLIANRNATECVCCFLEG